VIIENLLARGKLGKKDLLVVLMSECKPCAFTSFDDANRLSNFGKRDLSAGAEAVKSCGKTHFEFRKKRPYETGRKKRKKGKRDPISLLCNGAHSENCNFKHFPD